MEMKNYQYDEWNLNIKLEENKLIGIMGEDKNKLLEILSLKKLGKGIVKVGTEKITSENILKYRKKISYIKEKNNYPYFLSIIEKIMQEKIEKENITIKNKEKKMRDSLRIVGLSPSYLKRDINTLSSSEKKKVTLAIGLLSNPDIILIEDAFEGLDKENEKKQIHLFQRLKDQYQKTIIVTTNDSNILYSYMDEMILLKEKKIYLTGHPTEIYLKIEELEANNFEVPEIVKFSTIARKKKIKIDYHKDVRDIMKDIYKHVS